MNGSCPCHPTFEDREPSLFLRPHDTAMSLLRRSCALTLGAAGVNPLITAILVP